MDLVKAAFIALKSLKQGEPILYTEYVEKFSYDYSTLSKRYHGVQGTQAAQYKSQQVLNDEQSKTLVSQVNKLTERGLPPSNAMLQNFAKEI